MSSSEADVIELDIRGQICPSSLLTVLREVNICKAQLTAGIIRLCFKTDHRNATVTVPDAVRNMGYDVSITARQGYYTILIAHPGKP